MCVSVLSLIYFTILTISKLTNALCIYFYAVTELIISCTNFVCRNFRSFFFLSIILASLVWRSSECYSCLLIIINFCMCNDTTSCKLTSNTWYSSNMNVLFRYREITQCDVNAKNEVYLTIHRKSMEFLRFECCYFGYFV